MSLSAVLHDVQPRDITDLTQNNTEGLSPPTLASFSPDGSYFTEKNRFNIVVGGLGDFPHGGLNELLEFSSNSFDANSIQDTQNFFTQHFNSHQPDFQYSTNNNMMDAMSDITYGENCIQKPEATYHMYQHHRMRTNRRKRERNMNINRAFDVLKTRIPNLPCDTKVSKIKILQLASDYIAHLNKLLRPEILEPANESISTSNGHEVEIDVLTADHNAHPNELDFTDRNDFKVDPQLLRIKRRRIEWGRIKDEIHRHSSNGKRRRLTHEGLNECI